MRFCEKKETTSKNLSLLFSFLFLPGSTIIVPNHKAYNFHSIVRNFIFLMLVLQLRFHTIISDFFFSIIYNFFNDIYIEDITNAIQTLNNEAHNRNNDTVVMDDF